MEFGKSNVLVVLILGELMYGFVGLFSRYFYDLGLVSIDITFLRLTTITVVLFIVLLIAKRELFKVKLKDLVFFVSFGVFKLLADLFFIFSMEYIPLALASVLQMMFPFYIIVLSLFLFKESINLKKLTAILVGFIGCTLITGNLFATGRIESMGAPEEVVTPDMIGRVFGMRARVEHDEEIGGLSVTLIGRDRGKRRSSRASSRCGHVPER